MLTGPTLEEGPEGIVVAPEWPPWSEFNPDDDSLATGWNSLLQVGNENDGGIAGMQDQVCALLLCAHPQTDLGEENSA